MTDPTEFTNWRTSSFSDGGDNCVGGGLRARREGRRAGLQAPPDRAVLVFDHDAWTTFIGGVRDGQLDGKC
jgi:hypothetical protein